MPGIYAPDGSMNVTLTGGTTGSNPVPVSVVSGGGNSGSTPSSSYTVQKTTNIATTGTLISAANSNTRRTIRNTGTIALELVEASGAAFGTGHPLPVGESFTFDDTGRTTAAVYAAGASAGGSTSVISY